MGLSNQKHWSILAGLSLVFAVACSESPEPTPLDDAIQDASDDTPTEDVFGDDDSGDESGFSQKATPWRAGPKPPASDLFEDYGLTEFNGWVDEVSWKFENGEPVLNHHELAYYAVANGRTFSFLGTTYPLTVLHEPYGPDYNRPKLKTFPDIHFNATIAGKAQKVDVSRIGRFSKSSIVGITNEGQSLKVSSLFAAPVSDDADIRTSIIAIFRLTNTGTDPIKSVGFSMKPMSGFEESAEGVAIFKQLDRRITTVCPDATWDDDKAAFVVQDVDLEAGASRDIQFWLFFYDGKVEANRVEHLTALAKASDVKAIFGATNLWWEDWFSQGLVVELDDPMVTDLIESFQYTLKAQISYNGAMSPLSHYGEYWTRDISSPVRMLSIMSRPDEARSILDYHHVAACANEGFFNASKVDWPTDVPCAVTDWSALPVLTNKTAAEAPSYIVHMYHRLFDTTGDSSLMREREEMLRYGLQKQNMDETFLLPFSDDETFRAAMAMNLNLDGGASMMFADVAWSLHSTLLYVAAADGLAAALGYEQTDDIVEVRNSVAATLDQYYWQEEEGFWAAMVYKDDLRPLMAPYEDVNLTAAWMNLEDALGWDRISSDINALVERAWVDELGVIQTNAGAYGELLGFDLSMGIATGMTPGFSLYALSRHRPDLAQKSFNAFREIATASGNVTEDYATKGFVPLMPFYDDSGEFGEIWARFRPWEGAQDAEAIIFYLTGLWPDAANHRVALQPHLPNNLPRATYRGLMAGGCKIDLSLEEQSETVRDYAVHFTGDKCNDLNVTLKTATWECGETDFCQVTVTASGCVIDQAAAATGTASFKAQDKMICTFRAE